MPQSCARNLDRIEEVRGKELNGVERRNARDKRVLSGEDAGGR